MEAVGGAYCEHREGLHWGSGRGLVPEALVIGRRLDTLCLIVFPALLYLFKAQVYRAALDKDGAESLSG